jgi:hypothetical protein
VPKGSDLTYPTSRPFREIRQNLMPTGKAHPPRKRPRAGGIRPRNSRAELSIKELNAPEGHSTLELLQGTVQDATGQGERSVSRYRFTVLCQLSLLKLSQPLHKRLK